MKKQTSHEFYLLIAALLCCAAIIGYNAIGSVPVYDKIELTEPIDLNFYASSPGESAASQQTENIESMEDELFIDPAEAANNEELYDGGFYETENYQNDNQPAPTSAAVKTTTPKTTEAQKTQKKVNINTATKSQLETLPGIGPAKAQAIIEYRKQFGPFGSVEELLNVSGIGEKTLDKLRDLCCV